MQGSSSNIALATGGKSAFTTQKERIGTASGSNRGAIRDNLSSQSH
jgi:hypothetical protein